MIQRAHRSPLIVPPHVHTLVGTLIAIALTLSACGPPTATGAPNAHDTAIPSSQASPTDTALTATPPSFTDPPTTNPLVTLGISRFVGSRNLLIKANQQVQFIDPTNTGGSHLLVAGTNGTYTKESGVPAELASENGMPIQAGQTITLTFTHPGTYYITCAPHPGMLVKIVVTA